MRAPSGQLETLVDGALDLGLPARSILEVFVQCGLYGGFGTTESACDQARRVFARRGITVNCVSPGFIATELIQDLPDELRKSYIAQIPLKRFGKPEEVAYCALFLASDEASFVTGSNWTVDGGLAVIVNPSPYYGT